MLDHVEVNAGSSRSSTPSGLERVVTAVLLVWACAFLSAAWWIGTERLTLGRAHQCVRETAGSSGGIEGSAAWGWIPPGKICHYDDGITTRPSSGRGFLVVALIGTSPLVLILARRRG